MSIEQFIEKWNVAYEDKEQKAEFAAEMESDLLRLVCTHKSNHNEQNT